MIIAGVSTCNEMTTPKSFNNAPTPTGNLAVYHQHYPANHCIPFRAMPDIGTISTYMGLGEAAVRI